MVAEVITLRDYSLRDIPATLRQIADQIERGDFPNAAQCAVVVSGEVIDVCLCGETHSAGDAHMLLAAGMQKLIDTLY